MVIKLKAKPIPTVADEITNPQEILDAMPEDISILSRPELKALCEKMGYLPVDTRAKPVKELREMLAARQGTGGDIAVAKPAPKKPAPVVFKLPPKKLLSLR